tara:strand:+ start:168 stop:374 length:207 start_codon:yes stop_codon:yes gene_type:complete
VQIKISDSLSDEIKTLLKCVGMQILHADTILVKEAQPSIDFQGGMSEVLVWFRLQLHAMEDSAMKTVR